MTTVKVYFVHDVGWTDVDYGIPDLCEPWVEIPEALFVDYLEAQARVSKLRSEIRKRARKA